MERSGPAERDSNGFSEAFIRSLQKRHKGAHCMFWTRDDLNQSAGTVVDCQPTGTGKYLWRRNK